MEQRRLGRLGHLSTVLVYGAAALAEVDQDTADASIAEALAAGINHVDVAADYGDAELRLRPWAAELGQVFLATKTGERTADAAWRQINVSLERLGVDRVDLIQLHAVGDVADLDRATGPGGALESAVRARDEGLVGGIGITGHGHEAPATHREALRRFPFDTVLTPWNYLLSTRDGYRGDFAALVEDCLRDDVGLMTIKTVARRNWPETADQSFATWYEPWDDPEHLDAAVAFALRQDGVTGIATPGDVRLLGRVVAAAERAPTMTDQQIAEILGRAPDYSSPFLRMPF
ncbi:MAG TPA: aldo/keto reductase [Candidatus Limnocylindria bacterium]|nr:aldo/keto reductase [Candidatus Limnocylindria bacterium]